MKSKSTQPATTTATRKATTTAIASRITARATGRELTIADNVNGATIKLVVNKEGGIERELTKCEKHDKQYGNNLAYQVDYMVNNVMDKKAGVAKNLQKIAKGLNTIPASGIRNLSNRYRAAVNAEYSLSGTPDAFFHEVTRTPKATA